MSDLYCTLNNRKEKFSISVLPERLEYTTDTVIKTHQRL